MRTVLSGIFPRMAESMTMFIFWDLWETKRRISLSKQKLECPILQESQKPFVSAQSKCNTTINFPGYVDTVKNGRLITRKDSLAGSIVNLLQSEDNNYDMAMDYFEKNFSYEHVAELWRQLLIDGNPAMSKKIPNLNYRLKWLKEVCRIIKKVLPLFNRLPILERIIIYFERMKYGKTTYIDSYF